MSLNAVEDALGAHLEGAGYGLPIAWDGLRYEPVADQPYLRAEFLPAEIPESGQEMGQGAPTMQRGSYIITALYPIANGPGPLRAMVGQLEARFARRQSLAAMDDGTDFRVRLLSASRGAMITGDGRNSLPVTVRWITWRP
jgi:hypothetical protein